MSGTRQVLRPTRTPSTDWSHQGVHPEVTLGSRFERCCATQPRATALVDASDDQRLTYAQLHTMVVEVAAGLAARGLESGDVICVQLPNWWEAAVVVHAALRLGAVVNPVVPIYREREMGFIVAQARPKMIVTPHRFRQFDYVEMLSNVMDSAEVDSLPLCVVVRPEEDHPGGTIAFTDLMDGGTSEVADVDAAHLALLLYTSGTTADPKGVLHSHQTLSYEVQSFQDLFALEADDAVFMPSPVTHITGLLYGLLLPIFTGCTSVLLDVWDPATAVDLVERESCRFVMGATPFLHGMVDEYAARQAGPSALDVFVCGGADVSPALIRSATEVLGCHVARVYGSSEFPTLCCGGPTDDLTVRADTDGMPIGPVSCRIEDAVDGVGELVIDGPEMFLGYADGSLNAEAFTDDGYFRTGDLASIDEGGAITIRGREKDIVLRGGENISVREVEDLLHGHPGVMNVAIVAMPDPVMVERSCAFVVPAQDPAPTLDELTAFLSKQRLAKQKFPERLEIVGSIPTTASGKVQKFVLRERVAALLAMDQ